MDVLLNRNGTGYRYTCLEPRRGERMGFKTDWSKYEVHSMLAKKKVSYPDTPLGRAIAKAMALIDAKEGAGNIKASTAAGYKARTEALIPLIGVDEDSGLLQASQIIGGVNRSFKI